MAPTVTRAHLEMLWLPPQCQGQSPLWQEGLTCNSRKSKGGWQPGSNPPRKEDEQPCTALSSRAELSSGDMRWVPCSNHMLWHQGEKQHMGWIKEYSFLGDSWRYNLDLWSRNVIQTYVALIKDARIGAPCWRGISEAEAGANEGCKKSAPIPEKPVWLSGGGRKGKGPRNWKHFENQIEIVCYWKIRWWSPWGHTVAGKEV